MKNPVKAETTKYLMLTVAALGLALRILLYSTGMDGRGLLVRFHWTSVALTVLTAAVLVAQNAAELLKSTSGDMEKAADEMGGFCDGNSWCMPMDASWNVIGEREQAVYLLEVTREAQGELPVGAALLRVTAAGETLVEIRVAWQEGN